MLLCPQKKGEYVEYITVLKTALMQFLDKLFGSDANDSTVQTGCNILKVRSVLTGLGNGKVTGGGETCRNRQFYFQLQLYCTYVCM